MQCEDAAPDAVARFEDSDAQPGFPKRGGSRQTRCARANDNYVCFSMVLTQGGVFKASQSGWAF